MRCVTGAETVLNVANYASGDSDTASLRTPRIDFSRTPLLVVVTVTVTERGDGLREP